MTVADWPDKPRCQVLSKFGKIGASTILHTFPQACASRNVCLSRGVNTHHVD